MPATKCCCCDLRTGVLVTGYISAILSFLGFICEMLTVGDIVDMGSNPQAPGWLGPVSMVLCLILVVLSIVLLLGVYMEKPKWMLVWIFTILVVLVYLLIYICLTLQNSKLWVTIPGVVIALFVTLYGAYIVWSYYKKLTSTD